MQTKTKGRQATNQTRERARARAFSQVRIVSGNDSKQFCRQWIFYIIFIFWTLVFCVCSNVNVWFERNFRCWTELRIRLGYRFIPLLVFLAICWNNSTCHMHSHFLFNVNQKSFPLNAPQGEFMPTIHRTLFNVHSVVCLFVCLVNNNTTRVLLISVPHAFLYRKIFIFSTETPTNEVNQFE